MSTSKMSIDLDPSAGRAAAGAVPEEAEASVIDRKKQEFPPARIWMPARDGMREGWYYCTGRTGTAALTAFRVAGVVEYEHEDARQTREGTGRIWVDLHLNFVTAESA